MILAAPLAALAAAVWCAIPRGARLAAPISIAAAIVSLLAALQLVVQLEHGLTVRVISDWVTADSLSALLLLLIAFVYVTASIFSWGYIKHEACDDNHRRLYYANFNFFAFSMLSIPLMSEIGLVWIFVELTTLLSILLVSYSASTDAVEAAWKYMVLTLLGATIAVLGILILFWALHLTGSTDFTWHGLLVAAPHMSKGLLAASFALLLVGYGSKIGFVPLHTWLPDAHSQAPSPVCALLSGIETSVILYVLLRLRNVFAADHALHVSIWFAVFGLLSVVVATFLIVQTHDYKRLFAFSTVEHMGIILTAASLFTPAGDVATLWQLTAHAVTKSLCFYAAGATLLITGTRDISKVRGLLGIGGAAGGALMLGALAIGGAPPFAAFLSELAVLRAAMLAHGYVVTGLLAIFITLGFFGLVWHAVRMLFGTNSTLDPHPLPTSCTVAIVIAAIPVVVLGVWMPGSFEHLLQHAAAVLGS